MLLQPAVVKDGSDFSPFFVGRDELYEHAGCTVHRLFGSYLVSIAY